MKTLALIAIGLLAACSGSSSSTTGDAGSGDAGSAGGHFTLQFSVTNDVRNSINLHNPLRGPVHGGIFHTEDVNTGGPVAGAQSVANVEVADVDLTDPDAGLSAASWTSPDLAPGDYTFLGYLDVNGDAGAGDPSSGDPVTLPNTNKVTVSDGGAGFLNGKFNLVYN